MGISQNPKTTDNEIEIRDIRPGELREASLLLRDAYRQYEKYLPPEAWTAYLVDIMNVRSRLPVSELIVAKLDGRLVGAVTLYANGSGSPEGWPRDWAGIRLLAVHPDYRGRGIGHALMEECARRCRARGTNTIGLHTTQVMDIAHKMYERMGFKRVPEYDFYPAPERLVMAYRLDLSNPNPGVPR